MALDITTWFALGTVGMALGTLLLVWGYTQIPEPQRLPYLDLVGVTLIATVAYGIMALDIGAVTSARGASVYIPRYVDWLLTTPMHVMYIGWLAGIDRQKLVTLGGLQAATIVLGLGGALVATPLNLLLFAVGSIVFAAVVYLLYGEIATAAREVDDQTLSLYRTLRNFIVVLWLIYPVIWLLGQPGLGLMDIETSALVVTYIDVVAKVGFGVIAFTRLRDAGILTEPESDEVAAAAD